MLCSSLHKHLQKRKELHTVQKISLSLIEKPFYSGTALPFTLSTSVSLFLSDVLLQFDITVHLTALSEIHF